MIVKQDTSIELLINKFPASIKYLAEKGIKCVSAKNNSACTLEEAAKQNGYGPEDIQNFVRDLNKLLDQRE